MVLKSFALFVRKFQTLRTNLRYPSIERGWFKILTNEDLNYFKSFLAPEQVVTDEDILHSYNIDWMKECRGSSRLLLRPKNLHEISNIVKYCNKERLALVPQGGNTGLSHGSMPVFDEIILSLANMNKIISIDEISGVLVCEAGCILKNLDDALFEKDLIMPLDLAAKNSCQIGGNLATNAGGIRLIRYGSLRGSVLGIEAVLPNGQILDCLNTMRKDNTGYDFKNLFIGSEGTLGIITKVAIHCPSRPKETSLAFFGCNNFETIIESYKLAKRNLGETLSAFEFMDGGSMKSVHINLGLRIPDELRFLPTTNGDINNKNQTTISDDRIFYKFYCLIEISTSSLDVESCNLKLENFCSHLLQDTFQPTLPDSKIGLVIATNSEQAKNLWKFRESITLSLLTDGYVYKYDLSLPSQQTYELVDRVKSRFQEHAGVVRIVGYGHFGDGNLHLNLTSKSFDDSILNEFQPYIYEELAKISNNRFSISAEHGIGLLKRDFVGHFAKNSIYWSYAKQIKDMFDPRGILNPYKYLPTQTNP